MLLVLRFLKVKSAEGDVGSQRQRLYVGGKTEAKRECLETELAER